ncbi:MAG: acetoin utilization protein acuB, partial [Bacteroidia bacterium]|nr:acetoin utilization protein acuB [Bacteroidia bacterium]
MPLREYIINDIKPISIDETIKDVQLFFNNLTYSHFPIQKNNVYLGCISEADAHCLVSSKSLSNYQYVLEGFFVRRKTIWLDVLEAFAMSNANIMPVLDEKNNYLGYYELSDFLSIFNETPFFSEPGGILIVEKGINDYSFSEVSQIVESNNAKLFGVFISKIENDIAEITIKIGNSSLSDII